MAVLLQATCELLNVRVEELDVHADLHDYGFDLVSLAGLIDRLNQEYQLDEMVRRTGARPLTPTIVLEHRDGKAPTLYGLAQFLVAEYASVFGPPARTEARDDEALQALLRRLLRV